jgi:preprotein translocase subunit SecG
MGFVSILIIIISVLLIIVVLIQNSKGGGIASNFASSTQVVGVKRQAEIIEKITWGLASALIVLSLASAALSGSTEGPVQDNSESVVHNSNAPSPNVAPTGGTGTPMPNGTNTITPTPTTTATGTQNP